MLDKFKVISGLILLGFFASFTSQTLIDISDFVIVITSLGLAYQRNEFRLYFDGFRPKYLWPVWLSVVAVGLFFNINIQSVINFVEFKWILTLLSITYLVFILIDENFEYFKLFNNISYMALILNVIAIYLYFTRDEGRAAGIYNAIMGFSHNIAPIFCLFFILYITNWNLNKKIDNLIIFLTVVTSGFLVLVTYTRGVWLGVIFAIPIVLAFWSIKRVLQFIGITTLLLAFLIYFNKNFSDRVFSKTIAETSSNDARVVLWKANLMMVRDYPFFGVGQGMNKNYLQKYFDEIGIPKNSVIISHAHNQYLQVWAGTGTFGLICYLFFLFSIFRTVKTSYQLSQAKNKPLFLGLLAAILCFLISALTEANFNISKNRFLFLLIAGMAIGIANRTNESRLKQASV